MLAELRRVAGIQARRIRYETWRVRAVAHRGSRFTCPVCTWSFDTMLPVEGRCSIRGEIVDLHTVNADCPRCGSGIRQRLAFAVLQQRTALDREPLDILHFAPDPGIYKALSHRPSVNYMAADLNPRRFVEALKLDITRIDLPGNHVDGVICIHVLEHIDDDRAAVAELFRIVRPGGWAIIAIPTYGETTYEDVSLDYAGRELWYGTGDHLRLNGTDFAAKLVGAGFTVDLIDIDDVPGNFVDRSQHTPHTESDRYIFFCRKPAI